MTYTKTLKHSAGNGFHVHGLLRSSEDINSISNYQNGKMGNLL